MTNVTENWLPVVGYEGIYEVSNLGKVRCSGNFYGKRKLGRIMQPSTTKGGYKRLPLNIGKNRTSFQVHRLVATAFIKNPNNYEYVNHINGLKTDNRAENLEWCSASYNLSHAYKLGLAKRPKRGDSHQARKVIHTESGNEFMCIKDAAEYIGIKHSTLVMQLLRGSSNCQFKYSD